MYLAGSVTITVADLDRAVRFYRDVLGLPVMAPASAGWAEVHVPGLTIQLALAGPDTAPARRRGRGRITINLQVADVDAARAELRRRGVRTRAEVDARSGRRRASFRDPDGTRLSLSEQPIEAARATIAHDGELLVLGNDALSVRYNLDAGTMDLTWQTGAVVRHAYAAARLRTAEGAQDLRSSDVTTRQYEQEPVDGPFGPGLLLRVRGESPDLAAAIIQTITVFEAQPFVLLRVTVERSPAAGPPIAADQIEVMAAGGVIDPPGWVSIGDATDPRLYRMPFTNNDDIAVVPAVEQQAAVSYWLMALFDAAGSAGLVAGATESRLWKSAAWFDGPTGSLSLFSGAPSSADTVWHAARFGDRVESAEFLIGGYGHYRNGLADLMRAVAVREPPLPAPDLPPVLGWSPWYQYEFAADEPLVRAIADDFVERWAPLGYRYINLDAGWNVMDGDWGPNPERFPHGMAALTESLHARGLLAGTYFVPFSLNPNLLDAPIAGTPYTFRDATVKDADGAPLPADILTWEYALDGTHPGTQEYLRGAAATIAGYGFDFVKLDFLHIGTQEGQHFDPSATGIEAFHRGMEAAREGFLSGGRPIYLSAAIAPLYLHQYVHSRRVGTDVNFGLAREATNIARSWFTALLYHRNDPDNVIVRADWQGGYSENLARMHTTMVALGGGLLIMGDDPRFLGAERAALLREPQVLALAWEGVAACPVDVQETPPATWAARLADGAVALGLFNWGDVPVQREVAFTALGLDPTQVYRVHDLWVPEAGGSATGSYVAELSPHSAVLLRIEA